MRAAVLREIGRPLLVESVVIDKPQGREVLIRTRAVGVCHSDLHFAEGTAPWPLPTILGHEASGVVEQVGSDVLGVKVGDHVVTCLSVFCGHCEPCLSGHMSRCASPETKRAPGDAPRLDPERRRISQFLNLSAFAEQMLVHEHACVAIRRDMPLDRAALIGCAVTTGVGAVVKTAGVEVGETVAVIGCGGVGLSAVNGAALAGAGRIIAIDTNPAKLDLARRFGATDVLDASSGEVAARVIELTSGGVHHAIEAIGLKATMEQAFAMLRSGGVATVAGMASAGAKIEVDAFALLGERRLQGSRMGSNRFPIDIPRYVDLYLQGRLNLDDLVSRHVQLDQINDAFAELKRGETVRSVIMFD